VGAGWHGDVVRAGESLRVAPEAVFSVLAVGRALVSVTGARWELSGHELVPLDSLGVGNRTGEGPADMSVSEGVVWVFVRD
jgi:thiamine pyrophosphokinase